MARAQAQYLWIFDGGATYQRWQNFYVSSTVSWNGFLWQWIDFGCDGMIDSDGADEGGLSIVIPATPQVIREVEDAVRAARLIGIYSYEFDTLQPGGEIAPLTDQTFVAGFVGEVVGARATLESIEVELGSSLSPVGAQIPPRLFSTQLIGVPCKL
jgi:hypothetical protein